MFLIKIQLASFLISLTLLPTAVLAAGSVGSSVPELNPLCWTKVECEAQGGRFILGVENCTGKTGKEGWGKCLAASGVTTSIAFGGQDKFNNIGEYILTVYKYAVTIVSIIAVAVIIIAGLQWLTSAGSSDRITQSKKRIGGALIGLVLVYGSYFILNSINPATVNLRLPQVWILRSIQVVPELCSDVASSTLLALAADHKDQNSEVKMTGKESYQFSYSKLYEAIEKKESKTMEQYYCGKRFFVKKGGGAMCFGTYCTGGDVCSPFGTGLQKYICKKSMLAGKITYSGNSTENTDWADGGHITNENDFELWALCKDGPMIEINGKAETLTSESGKYQSYSFVINDEKTIKDAVEWCKKVSGDIAGFALKFPMDESGDPTDEIHFIGNNNGKGIDLGDEGFFIRQVDSADKKKWTSLSYDDYMWNSGVKDELLIDPKWEKQIGTSKAGATPPLNIDANSVYDIDIGTKEKITQEYYVKNLQDKAKDQWTKAGCFKASFYACKSAGYAY